MSTAGRDFNTDLKSALPEDAVTSTLFLWTLCLFTPGPLFRAQGGESAEEFRTENRLLLCLLSLAPRSKRLCSWSLLMTELVEPIFALDESFVVFDVFETEETDGVASETSLPK